MSLANRGMKPIPSGPKNGEFRRIELLYKGLKRIIREFDVDNGDQLMPSNIDLSVFDSFGTKDTETTRPEYNDGNTETGYENCYLEEQQIAGAPKEGRTPRLRQIYIEAYIDELREIEKPRVVTDENGRRTTERTFVVLNAADDSLKYGTIGTTADPDFSDNLLAGEEAVEGNAVTIIRRRYLQATDTLAQVGKDDRGKTRNGLLTVTRQFIGTDSAPIGDEDVGTDTITVDVKTLYLGGVNAEVSDGFSRVQKVWVEPGILQQSTRNLSEGVKQTSITFLGVEQAVDGPIIVRSIGEFDGLRTITLTYLQNSDGDSIVGNGGEAKLAISYQSTDNFTYPGEVTIQGTPIVTGTATSIVVGNPTNSNGLLTGGWTSSVSSADTYDISLTFVLYPPVSTPIRVTREVYFQEGSTIADAEYNAMWKPDEWARGAVRGVSNGGPLVADQGFRGYRASNIGGGYLNVLAQWGEEESSPGGSIRRNLDLVADGETVLLEDGFLDSIYASGTEVNKYRAFQMFLDGGPERPDGNEYILGIDIRPSFEDVDGTKYYKKTIIRATIPDRGLS